MGRWVRFVYRGEYHYIGLLWFNHQNFALTPSACRLQGVLHQVPEGF